LRAVVKGRYQEGVADGHVLWNENGAVYSSSGEFFFVSAVKRFTTIILAPSYAALMLYCVDAGVR